MPLIFRIAGFIMLIAFLISVIWFMVWLVSELVSIVFGRLIRFPEGRG